MKRITTPALAVLWLCSAATAAQDEAADRAAILELMDKSFSAVASGNPKLGASACATPVCWPTGKSTAGRRNAGQSATTTFPAIDRQSRIFPECKLPGNWSEER